MSKINQSKEKPFAEGQESIVYKREDKLLFVPTKTELTASVSNPEKFRSSAKKLREIVNRLKQNPAIRIAKHKVYTGKEAIKIMGGALYEESFTTVFNNYQKQMQEKPWEAEKIKEYATCTEQSMLSSEYKQIQTTVGSTETICAMKKPNITACDALDQLTHIHAAGVTHSDIGAHNLFVKQEGKDVGTVHFIDFGDGQAALEGDTNFDTEKKEDSRALAWTILESVYQVKNNVDEKRDKAQNSAGKTIYRTQTRDRIDANHEEFKQLVAKAQLMKPSDEQEIAATKAFIIAVHAGKSSYQIYQDIKKNHGTSQILKTIQDISTVKEKKTAQLIEDGQNNNLGNIEILSELIIKNPNLCKTESFRKFRESAANQSIEKLRSKGLDEFRILSHIAEKEPELRKTKTVQNIINRCKTINVLLVVVSILIPPLAPRIAIKIVDNVKRIQQAENAQPKTVEKAESTSKKGNNDLNKPLLSRKSSTPHRPEAFNQGKTTATVNADKENHAQGPNEIIPKKDDGMFGP